MRKESGKPGILVVDDDKIQSVMIQRVLEESFEVYLAEDTGEAEAVMARVPDLQVLLCDQQMPGELGLDYCRRLQKRQSPLVRILMTGYIEQAFLLEAINSQALFHYLVKPFDQANLLEVIDRATAYYAERKEELAKRLALEETEAGRKTLLRKLSHAGQVIVGVGSMVLITSLIVLVVTAGVGLLLLLVLYLLKSFLGIDVFKDSHLSDWF